MRNGRNMNVDSAISIAAFIIQSLHGDYLDVEHCSEKKSRESPDPPVISRRFREIWKFVPPQSYRARLNKQKG